MNLQPQNVAGAGFPKSLAQRDGASRANFQQKIMRVFRKAHRRVLCRNQQKGSSTIELLIAFMILILAISAVVIVLFGNQSVSVDTQTGGEALYRAQALLEDARAASRADFDSVVSHTPVVEQAGPISYTKRIDVVALDAFTKSATSTVSWQIAGRSFTTSLSTILTDPKSAIGGDTCSQALSGDWTHPQLQGSADIGQNNAGTDVDVLNGKAYVTTDSGSASKDDFYVIDVSDPTKTNLPILGSVNTGPGLASVRVAGTYAYVAHISTVSQLQVIDVSKPEASVVAARLRVTPPGDQGVGHSIFYANKKVYLGLTKSAGPELYVIDVSNPLKPVKRASYETNTQVSAITVKNNIAYLAVPDDPSSPAPEQLRLLDVSNADSGIITQLGTFSYPNASTMSGESVHVSKDGATLYLGRGGANSAKNPELFVLNAANPGSVSKTNSKYIDASAYAIVVRSDLAFLWTADTNRNFQIWDLNNLNSPTPYGSLNTGQTAAGGIDCEGNLLYVAQRNNKGLQIIGPS